MKIGIITFHHTTNYGATLQAYALWKTLENQGYDVEIIDYRPLVAVNFYRQRDFKNILGNRNKLKPRNSITSIQILLKRFRMESFISSHMKFSERRVHSRDDLKTLSSNYDIVISGSDQVWCIDSFRGFDPSYFLDFVDGSKKRKMSYAASFSSTRNLGEFREHISNLINDFGTVLVRDSHSLKLVQDECSRLATKVLDPTFLIDFKKIISPLSIRKEYLLLYLQDKLSREQEQFAKSLADSKDLTIVSLGNPCEIAAKKLIHASPKEWVTYFQNASYIITDTYHGSIFSIKNKKPFTVFVNESKMIKVSDLLNELGLSDRLANEVTSTYQSKDHFSIDYDSVYEILNKRISESKTHLFESINGKECRV